MPKSHLEKLEQAYLEVSAIQSDSQREAYLLRLSENDPEIYAELRNIIQDAAQQEDFSNISAASFLSLEKTRIEEESLDDSFSELLQLLKKVSPGNQENILAQVEGYQLQKLVGVGPVGFVFRAWDHALSRQVAIKILRPSIANRKEHKEAFVREARLASAIQSAHVARIFHIFGSDESDLVFFAMEWVNGITLTQWMRNHDIQNEKLAIEYFSQLATAIADIHKLGIIHRDIKPSNILVEQQTNRLVVVDFGLAIDSSDSGNPQPPAGTPLFMSPEQIIGDSITYASDQFSLAEVTCLLVFGFHPHQRDELEELTQHILHASPEFPKNSRLNPRVRAAIEKALSKIPANRHQSVATFRDEFLDSFDRESLRDITGVESREKTRKSPISAKVLGVVVIAIALLISFDHLIFPVTPNENLASDTENISVHGQWLDADYFENFAGLKFRYFGFDGTKINNWPPDPNFSEMFEELGWLNMNQQVLISDTLTQQDVFDAIVGNSSLNANKKSRSAAVNNISYDEAMEFCNNLTKRDPDGLIYSVCHVNVWTFATYGKAILEDNVPTAHLAEKFNQNRQTYAYSCLQDSFQGMLEWSSRRKAPTTRLEGVVPLESRLQKSVDDFMEVIGGTHGILVHAFDMNFGVNDHLLSWSGFVFHVEEDGETCYLHPAEKDQLATIVYHYRLPEIFSATIRSPFGLFTKNGEAGISIRGKPKDSDSNLKDIEWKDIAKFNGKHFPSQNRPIDITDYVKGLSEIQIRYWIRTNDQRLTYSQFGRTTNSTKLTDVGCVQFITADERTSPRQSFIVPRKFKSPEISFRISAIFPKEQKGKTTKN